MNGSQLQKGRVDLDLDQDYISNLPRDAKEKVLMKLPIKEAVKTSVLSSKWRYTWSSIPKLVFREDCTESRLIKLVDKVLLTHHGPIVHFELVTAHACNEAIGQWMIFLSRNGIKNLYIRSDSKEKCKIPDSFFSCLALEDVLISSSTIHVPPRFLGFKFLRTLELSQFILTGITIGKFISSCPLLERLNLSDLVEHGCLVVRAPNLRWLGISGKFHDLCLETRKLLYASIDLAGEKSLDFSLTHKDRQSNIWRALGSLSAIEELVLGCYSVKYLAMGPIPEVLPVPFYHLKRLHINLDSTDKDEVAAAFCLYKSVPNLKVLTLELEGESYDPSSPAQTLWEVQSVKYNLFKCLEIVNVPLFKSPESVLEVAKLVLSTAPVLEKLTIRKKDVKDLGDGTEFLMKLASFSRLSKKAEIVFVEHSGI